LLALFVAQEIDLRILTLPDGDDPCDVIATQGSDAFRQLLSRSVDALDHKIQAVTNGLASAPGTHRSAQAVEEILTALARALPAEQRATSISFVREQQVLARLSREFGLAEDVLRTRLIARRRELAARGRVRGAAKSAGDAPRVEKRWKLAAWEQELVELLLHQPEVLPRLAEVLTPEEIPSEVCRGFYVQALAAMHAGQIPSFEQLMLATDDPEAKSLLVDCDEHGREKLASDADCRARDLLAHVAQTQQTARDQSRLADLKQNRFDPQHEQEVLAELFHDLKRRQTGSAPTEG
jgi:DNA primase